jgi:serine/threonine protein kinase
MEFSVQNICGFLIRSRLLTPDEVKAMYQRWLDEAKDGTNNAAQFGQWLVASGYVTDYQASLVARGLPDNFFLNQYKILDRLGQGGMAGVYKAVHSLGQVVAIKVLPPSRAKDPRLFGRFQREARLALRLKHPNIVRAFQIGETNGLNFLVMEYLEGETLEEVLKRRGKLPPAEAVRLVYQALMGLQHIHEQGLIHRDLKPSNLMLIPAAVAGMPDNTLQSTVKILDIGLGRALFDETLAESGGKDHLTGEGVLLGTPDYLAPEQARNAHAVDIRADIYSLGCVLYHALAGRPPFPDSNVITQMVRHLTEAPRPLREFNPAVPDGLQQILDWLMAKEPSQRYPTPERAAQALQVFLAAGSGPLRTPEGDPKTRLYLTWLEKSGNGQGEPAAAEPPPAESAARKSPEPAAPAAAAAKAAAPPVAKPTPAPAGQPAPPPAGIATTRRSKRHQRRPTPAPAAPARVEESKETFDVELVPVVPPAAAPEPRLLAPSPRFGLSRRDLIMLGMGAGGLGAGVGLGYALARLVALIFR